MFLDFFKMAFLSLDWKCKSFDEKRLKKIVTAENILDADDQGEGIMVYLALYAKGRTDLIEYFYKMGASLFLDSEERETWSLLHYASRKNTPEVVRQLLDYGVPVNITDGENTPLDNCLSWHLDKIAQKKIAKILIDAGGIRKRLDISGKRKFEWIEGFKKQREEVRLAAISILSLLKSNSSVIGKNGKDVLSVIGRCVWEARGISTPNPNPENTE